MNMKKISSLIISASIVAGGVALTGNVVYAQTLNNKTETTASNKVATGNNLKETTTKAITVDNDNLTANITVNKSWSSSGNSTNSAGGNVDYTISTSFRASDLSSVESIKNFKVTLSPQLYYTNYDEMTSSEQTQANEALAQLNKLITYTVTPSQDGVGNTVTTTTSITQ